MFRDDFEAARARAQAAERELAQLRREGGEERARRDAAEHELAEAKVELARLRKQEKQDRRKGKRVERCAGP